MGHPDPDTSARVVWLSQPPPRLGYHLVPPERSLWSLREEMVPSLLSVFTFYIIAAIAPAGAKLQPRAVRHLAFSVTLALRVFFGKRSGSLCTAVCRTSWVLRSACRFISVL